MKKFYALALAAFALTASAQSLQVGDLDLNPIKAKPAKIVRHEAPVKAASVLTPTAAPAIDDVTGYYTWECFEFMTSGGVQIGESTYGIKIAALEDNEVEIILDYGTFKGTFDPATGNISIPVPQASPIVLDGEEYEACLFHTVYDVETEEDYETEDPIVLTYVNGSYETGVDDFIVVLAMFEGESEGAFHYAGDNLFTKYVVETPAGWNNLGFFLYQDYCVLGPFNLDPADYKYEVTVLQKADNENIYRILNPYTTPTFPLLSYNNNPADGYIEIDVTNPNFILVSSPEGAGCGINMVGYLNIYPKNFEYYLQFSNPNAGEETIIEYMESKGFEFTTFEDDTLTIPNTLFGLDEGSEDPEETQESIDAPYSWQGDNPHITILWLGDPQSGINNVVADNDNNVNAPVVYYNLQGVQVANPAGGIFIRKQGNKTTKVIVK